MNCKLCDGLIGRYSRECKSCGATYQIPRTPYWYIGAFAFEIMLGLNAPVSFWLAFVYKEPYFLLLVFVPMVIYLVFPFPRKLELIPDNVRNGILKNQYERKNKES